MPFIKGMKPTKGFTDKKHTSESKRKMSEARKANHPAKKCRCYVNYYGELGTGIENRPDCAVHGQADS